jgi:hypothetical protein
VFLVGAGLAGVGKRMRERVEEARREAERRDAQREREVQDLKRRVRELESVDRE